MLEVAEGLSAEHELLIAHGALDDPGNPAAVRARASFETYELPALRRPLAPRADIAAARAVAALCRRLQPDVLHTHSSKAGIVGRLAVPSEVPVVIHTIHGWGHTPADSAPRRRLLIAAERLAARRTTRLIAVSRDVRDEGIALRIGRADQYAVVGEIVDLRPAHDDFSVARAAARSALGIDGATEVVGWVGRFSDQKDPRTLAEVLVRLLATRPHALAVLIGDGPDRERVSARVEAAGIGDRVLFAGSRPDVRRLYAVFDVLVHTSRWEGHPRVIQEALAEGVPVVTARVSGTRDILVDPRLGTQVTPGEPEEFVDALTAILDAPDRRAPLPGAVIESLLQATGDPLAQTATLYRELLATHAPAGTGSSLSARTAPL
jgi:glycosyltransferase involved in cell wall biosynthesis